MVTLVGLASDWAPTWCLFLDILDMELIRKGNNQIINKLLNVEEKAFKYDRSEVRVQAFICWRHLISKFLPANVEVWMIFSTKLRACIIYYFADEVNYVFC